MSGNVILSRTKKLVVSQQVSDLAGREVDFSHVEDDVLPVFIRELVSSPENHTDSQVLDFTTRNSRIAKILYENPASDAMLRIVYPDTNGHPLTEGLDRFLSRSLSGQALRDRLEVCSAWLAENFLLENKTVIDFGGGSGSYAFRALEIKKPPLNFKWRVLDIDDDSLAICHKRIQDNSLSGVVETRRGNFMSAKSVDQEFDFGVLIGVLCGMDFDTAVNCLLRCKSHLKSGAQIYAATLLQQAFEEDPCTFRLLCNVGEWQLRPKELSQVLEIFKQAGWEVINVMSERFDHPGQYAIVHASAL